MALALGRQVNNWMLPVCLAAMDACWVLIAASIFNHVVLTAVREFTLPSPVVLAGLELGAWAVASLLLNKTNLPNSAVQIASGLLGLSATCGVIAVNMPTADTPFSVAWFGSLAFSIIIGMALWFIGGYRASQEASFSAAYATFRVGMVIIGVAVVVLTVFETGRASTIWASLGALPIWFFVWALCALALGNREVVREEGGRAALGLWALVAIISAALVLLLGTAAGAFGGVSLVNLAGEIVGGIFALVVVVIYGILWVIVTIASFFRFKVNTSSATPTPPPTPRPGTTAIARQSTPVPDVPHLNFNIPPELREIATWIAAMLIIFGLVWLLNRGVRRTLKVKKRSALEERESLGSWALLMEQWEGWLDRILGRTRPAALITREDDLAALRGQPEWSGTLSVRQIYAHLQSQAARVGYPRAPQQTPIEYLSVLSAAMPDLRSDFRDITSAYLEARYGPMPASAPAVLAATRAWKRAEPTLRGSAEEYKSARS